MFKRFLLCIGSVTAAAAACVLIRDRWNHRRIPVRKAAAMLQEAWADHHHA